MNHSLFSSRVSKRQPVIISLLIVSFFLAFDLRAADQLPPVFSGLEVIEEIDCSAEPKSSELFRQFPEGISTVETILGQKTRVLSNEKPGMKYFGYRIGRGQGLEANAGYVLEIEYPEDAPRAFFVINQGAEINRGLHTGVSLGDARKPRYVNNLPESLSIPLSGRTEKWQMLFHLHERFPDQFRPRDNEFPRDQTPKDGFWVFIAQFTPENDPLSRGAAVSRIRLMKAPSFEDYALKINFPPEGLPRRHLFFREEMADGVIGRKDPGLTKSNDWYVHKARLHRFLGMNTFAKDLLEFGANQGWDSTKFGGDAWVFQSHDPKRWENLIRTATEYGLELLPYYEYSGSKGREGLGREKRARPLGPKENYTHIPWTETERADLTDPDTFEDFRKMLEITIADFRGKGTFTGAWLRPRSSQLPMSFSDAALARFSTATRRETVTREMLRSDKTLYSAYREWWFAQRRDFLNRLGDYVRSASGNPAAAMLFTADVTEPGRPHPDAKKAGLVAEDPSLWPAPAPTSLNVALKDRRQFEALTLPGSTWGGWEWQHAVPEYDPESFRDSEVVLPTFTFHRTWSVADVEALQAFRTKAGLAMIRHYSLNENMFRDGDEKSKADLFGYFVSDAERTGPFCMQAETLAVANGDPSHIGYLASSAFNRGFPQYVRAFNAAFLALPALPSERLTGGCPDAEVVLRRIDAGKHGVYFAVANTGYTAKEKLRLKLPDQGRITNAATGEVLAAKGDSVTVDLFPCQLLSLRLESPRP